MDAETTDIASLVRPNGPWFVNLSTPPNDMGAKNQELTIDAIMNTPGRVQLALNVADLSAAVRHYTDMFGTGPSKERPGYANFAIADPPLKLVLFENPDAASPLNHLGVELRSTADVIAVAARFADADLEHTASMVQSCCHAVQDKIWVSAPDVPLGAWEFYTVLDDAPNDTYASSTEACCTADSVDEVPCCGNGKGSLR